MTHRLGNPRPTQLDRTHPKAPRRAFLIVVCSLGWLAPATPASAQTGGASIAPAEPITRFGALEQVDSIAVDGGTLALANTAPPPWTPAMTA